ncbi:MAG: hypothetical protein JWL63_2978 [Rhodocyclales bacterium]|nr:hypothetical protein [Rhodocyclales bacterium]
MRQTVKFDNQGAASDYRGALSNSEKYIKTSGGKMSSQFQIVFKGELLDGFDLVTVKASAARRLKAAPEQIDRVFSGTRAILKKGLTDELAQRYLTELQRIGMRVAIEAETIKAPAVVTESAADSPASAAAPQAAPRTEPQRVTSRDQPAFDPAKTQIASMQGDSPSPTRWSQPTIAISQRHLNEMQHAPVAAHHANSSMEPTMIVPPRSRGSSEPTIVVSRGSAASQPTMIVPPRQTSASSDQTIVVPPRHSAASEPTMIVPPRHGSSSDPTLIVPPRRSAAAEPTMIVPPRHSASSEPTMIVPPRQSASSDATMIVAPRHAPAAQATIIVRSNQKLPPAAGTSESGFDPERTLIANSEIIDDYLSAAPDESHDRPAPPEPPAAAPQAAALPEVQCPTCGDKQPKRVYCRRCGHALSLPPKSTVSEAPVSRPATIPHHGANDETVLYEEAPALEPKKEIAGVGLGGPVLLVIALVFVLLLSAAAWLLM